MTDAPNYATVQQCVTDWAERWPNFQAHELRCRGTGTLKISVEALDALQRLRNAWGPIIPASAYRSVGHNANVGGSPKSQHLIGKAFDIHLPQEVVDKFVALARNAGFRWVGYYSWGVHIDVRATRGEKDFR